jgi:hypothetical protein
MQCEVRFLIFHFKWKMENRKWKFIFHLPFAMENDINDMYTDSIVFALTFVTV